MVDLAPLVEALQKHLQVTLTYVKKKDGTTVIHKGGIYEIGPNARGETIVWLFDTTLNDHIRQFLAGNIESFEVLAEPFISNNPWDFKLNGEIIP